jgi:hypothetical protein
MDSVPRDLSSGNPEYVMRLLRGALDHLHGEIRAAASRALDVFQERLVQHCCPPDHVAAMLPHFLHHLNATELRNLKGEIVACLGFGTFLGCTVDDKTLKLIVYEDGNYRHSNLAGSVMRAAEGLAFCGLRLYSPVTFSLPRVPGRLEYNGRKKSPRSYALAWDEKDPLDVAGPEAFALLNARQTEPCQELAPLPPSVAITDAPPGSKISVLCAGALLIRQLPNGECDSILILSGQHTHYESLVFSWVGLHVPADENGLENPVQLTGSPDSDWKIIGAQRVRLVYCHGGLFALPVVGEPGLSLWALGEHIARVQDKRPRDVFYDLSVAALAPMFGLRRLYPVNRLMVAVADARRPHYYPDIEAFIEDVSMAISAAAAAAGEREASAERLIKEIRPPWARSAWDSSCRIYLPAHGPLTAGAFDMLASRIRFGVEQQVQKSPTDSTGSISGPSRLPRETMKHNG